MRNILFIKKEGQTFKTVLDPSVSFDKGDENKENITRYHLCGKCENCFANKCLKVQDRPKKAIHRYDFITEGVQLYTEGQQEYFFVMKCNNFVKERRREPSVTALVSTPYYKRK